MLSPGSGHFKSELAWVLNLRPTVKIRPIVILLVLAVYTHPVQTNAAICRHYFVRPKIELNDRRRAELEAAHREFMAHSEQDQMVGKIGHQVYRTRVRLGGGNDGVVYLESVKGGRQVVIKAFHKPEHIHSHLELLDQLEVSGDVRTLRVLEVDEGQGLVVFEYVRGLPLDELIYYSSEWGISASLVSDLRDRVKEIRSRDRRIIEQNLLLDLDTGDLVLIDSH